VPTLSEAALAFAVSQVGVHEQGGNNQGPEVNAYLASVGLDPGYSWCAAFVYFCFKQAAAQLGLVNPCPKTAGAVKLWTLTEPICRVTAPVPGAIYVLQHEGGKGHAGIIERVSDGAILEVSGNTNDAGSREGNAVARHGGISPQAIHGGTLLGYLSLDLAAQAPSALVS
jgi:uncharacterized protein (TIGR02594 family)